MEIHLLELLQGYYLQLFIAGTAMTLRLFFASLFSGFALAVLLTALRATGIPVLRWVIAAFVEYHRNVPALVQIFVWYFGVSQLFPAAIRNWMNAQNGEFLFAYIALGLNVAAYMSEDLRSGLRSIARTQMEAARALGLNFTQAMRDVMLPQALRVASPPLVSQSLGLFKATSLAMAIGVAELTYSARLVDSDTFRTFEAFAIVSVIYLVGSWSIAGLGYLLESRLRRAGSQ